MALFHFHVTQIKRSAGQSAVACAAYRAGEKLYSEYYGEASDFTRKGGVVCSEIILPPMPLPSTVTALPSGTPWRKPSAARKPSLHTALEDLLHYADLYRETKPIYDELRGIKWKGKREKFEAEHERDLKMFHMARRKLEKHFSPAGKLPVQAWRQELASLQQKYQAEYERYKPMREDLMELLRVKNCVDTVTRQQEQDRERRQTVER